MQQLLMPKPCLRQMNNRAQTVQAVAVDNIGMDTRLGRALNFFRIGVGGKHNQRTRRTFADGQGGFKKLLARNWVIANNQIWCAAHDLLHHFAAQLAVANHGDADRLQVGCKRMLPLRAF